MKENVLKENYLEVLEYLDWNVIGYYADGQVEIEGESPAGEDLIFCFTVENFPESVYDCYEYFDKEEHVRLLLEAKENGLSGVPDVITLAEDAKAIEDMLEELFEALQLSDSGKDYKKYDTNEAEIKVCCCEDTDFLTAMLRRLKMNFLETGNPKVVLTDSETAADALKETLCNMGMDTAFTKIDGVDENGQWYARFEVII